MNYVFDATLGATTLKQVVSSVYTPNNTAVPGRGSGAVDPGAFHVTGGQPQAKIQSTDIAGALGAVSVSVGLNIAAGTAFVLPYNKAAAGGTFTLTAAYTLNKASTAAALIVPDQIAASEQEDATIDLTAYLTVADGFTAPMAENTGVTISGQAFSASFAFGGVAIDGSMVDYITGATVVPGITTTYHPNGGKTYPQAVSITQRNPYIDLEFADHDAIAGHGPNFEALTSAVVYLRKRTDGGTFVATGTLEHIAFSFAAGLKDVQEIGASGDSPGRPRLRLWGKALTSSTASAIPAFS